MGILASAPSASAGARRIDRRDRLVAEGVASVADIDTAISVVPGLRWALMGPHLTFPPCRRASTHARVAGHQGHSGYRRLGRQRPF